MEQTKLKYEAFCLTDIDVLYTCRYDAFVWKKPGREVTIIHSSSLGEIVLPVTMKKCWAVIICSKLGLENDRPTFIALECSAFSLRAYISCYTRVFCIFNPGFHVEILLS